MFCAFFLSKYSRNQLKLSEIIDCNLDNDNLNRPVHFLMASSIWNVIQTLHYFKYCDKCIMFMLLNYYLFYLNMYLIIFIIVTFIKLL